MTDAPTPPPPAREPVLSFRRVTLAAVTAVLVAGAVYAVVAVTNPPPAPVNLEQGLRGYLTEQGRHSKLAEGYADADGDLVADPPADPAKLVDPVEILFTVVGTDAPAAAEKNWRPFMDHLARTTGKPVKYLRAPAPSPEPPPADGDAPTTPPADGSIGLEGQFDAVKSGRLHVTAFNTGAVERAVNEAGFVPLFCPADKAGKHTYEMEIIVPAGSPVKTPADLKGKTIALVTMSSNSGGKAPFVRLKEEFGLLPGRDYSFQLTGSHDRSILGVCAGKYDAAAVANDILRRHVAEGKDVTADKFRSIYTSNPFPPLCFGVPNTLAPAARDAVVRAFETAPADALPNNAASFARVEYKKDFAFVRDVDAKLARLFAPQP